MQHLPSLNAIKTMSSREIAELTCKRHDNVLRVARELAEQGITHSEECLYQAIEDGRKYPEHHLNKRDSLVLVARLSPEFTAAIVDRWQELEGQSAPAIPTSLSAALRLAADQAEQIEQQQAQIAAAAPKVEFVDRYVDSTGSKGFRQVCKLLGVKEPAFRDFLMTERIMYRLGGEMVPHSQHLDAGRFTVKAGTSEVSGHAYNSARFTPKGIAWVAGLWAASRLESGAV